MLKESPRRKIVGPAQKIPSSKTFSELGCSVHVGYLPSFETCPHELAACTVSCMHALTLRDPRAHPGPLTALRARASLPERRLVRTFM